MRFIDRVIFKPAELIKEEFQPQQAYEKKPVWNDVEDCWLTNVVLTDQYMLVFSENNCYRIGKNQNNKFNRKFIDIIPSLSWRQFYLSDQKHVYLLRDKTFANKAGLSYFDVERFYDKDRAVGHEYKDLTVDL